MRKIYLFLLVLITFFSHSFNSVSSQNISINIIAANAGQIKVGEISTLDLEVRNNAFAGGLNVAGNRLRPQISFPTNVAVLATGNPNHVLPGTWSIVQNDGQNIRVCQGAGTLPANTTAIIKVAIIGVSVGGPATIQANLAFSTGTNCSGFGSSTSGDLGGDNSGQASITTEGLVPITLSEFKGNIFNCNIQLNWSTKTEQNSDRFEIERFDVKSSNWKKITTIKAGGFTVANTDYAFIDNELEAKSVKAILYRLKMVDKDGSFSYSKTISILNNCHSVLTYVYPNPVINGNIFVNLSGYQTSNDAVLISLNGQIVLRQKLENGINKLNVMHLHNGLYNLIINDSEGNVKQVKVQIQK